MVYAEFGGQTECIMGNWKLENKALLLLIRVKHFLYRLGLSTVSKLVRFLCWVGVDAICTLFISLPFNKSSVG